MRPSPETCKVFAEAFRVGEDDVPDILKMIDVYGWLGGSDILFTVKYAGCVESDDVADKSFGHSGYFVADDEEHVAYVFNGNPAWLNWDEEVATDLGLAWGDFFESMESYKINRV